MLGKKGVILIKIDKSKGAIRVIIIFGFIIPLMLFRFFINYHDKINLNLLILSSLLIISLLISVNESQKIIKLKQKKESKKTTIILSLLIVSFLILISALKELKLFIWNENYFTLPFLLFVVIVFIVSLIIEKKKKVRIYITLTGLEFVKKEKT